MQTRLNSGEFASTDHVWYQGLPQWISVSELLEAKSAVPPPPPPPLGVSTSRIDIGKKAETVLGRVAEAISTAVGETSWRPMDEVITIPKDILPPPPPPPPSSQPAFWNPKAAALWSIWLTPAFGAFISAKNWEAMGKLDEAKKSYIWGWSIIAILFVLAAHADTSRGPMTIIYLGLLTSWFFSDGRKQLHTIASLYGTSYSRKWWRFPLGVGIACLFLYNLFAGYRASVHAKHHPFEIYEPGKLW